MKHIPSKFEKHFYRARRVFKIAIARKLCACISTTIALVLLLASPSGSAYTLSTSTSLPLINGLWGNNDESGWGVNIIQQYDVIFATIFTYNSEGNPVWYVASNCAIIGDNCQGELYGITGGSMLTSIWDGTGKVLTTVGTIKVVFASGNNATIYFTINGTPGSKAITRSVWRTASPVPTAPPAVNSRSCSGNLSEYSLDLIVNSSARIISVSVTGTTNTSLFAPHYVSLIQGNNSVMGTILPEVIPGILWTGAGGFQGGSVPTGVIKTGTFSGFPSWFDFSQPFIVNDNINGTQFTC